MPHTSLCRSGAALIALHDPPPPPPFRPWLGAQVMNTREFVDGDVVVREGDMGDEFFIIQKGTCHVYKLLPDRPTI